MTPAPIAINHSDGLQLEASPSRKHCELPVGSLLGRYRVVEEIGRGGHGVVYRALDVGLGREVALKTVVHGFNEQSFEHPIATEAQLLSRVDDPHVVGIFDVIAHAEATVLVMELVNGLGLDSIVRTEKLTVKEVSALGIQLAEGLDALHRHAIVHCDIKPANLRLSGQGVLKILDLGVAQLVSGAAWRKRPPASRRVIAGTVPYMSPELLSGSAVDVRSDIWSAGTVLFELATGQRAFGKTATTSPVSRILTGVVTRPHEIRPDISGSLELVILKALNPDPDRRFQSAGELIEGLYDVLLDTSRRSLRREAPIKGVRPLVEGASAAATMRLAWCGS